MKKVKLAEGLEVSRVIHGHWRLADWQMKPQEIINLTEELLEAGIDTIDHADIYGNYTCEAIFGEALALKPTIREKIKIVSKCGIKLISDKYPERKIKSYDYSYQHIIQSVDNSLNNLKTDYLDLLLLHRPAPFFDPEDVAKAFAHLRESGKVLHFGVSNFNPQQFSLLNSYLPDPLVTNQIEISPYCLNAFEDGSLEFLIQERVKPMAWSPLAGGNILKPSDEKGYRLYKELSKVANELEIQNIDHVVYAWLLKHPAQIMPVVGSGKADRVISAIQAVNSEMTEEQWYRIYIASTGQELP